MPAIKSIQENCDLFNLDSKNDYRFRALEQNKLYFYPLSSKVENKLEEIFKSLIGINKVKVNEIEILQRKIKTVKSSKGVVWFDFKEIAILQEVLWISLKSQKNFKLLLFQTCLK